MSKTLKLIAQILLLVCLQQSLVGCAEEEDDGLSGSPSTTPGNPVTDTPVGEVEGTGFWVNVQSDWHPVYVNSDSGFGTDCFIAAGETNSQVMNCYVDVLEADLFVHDIELQYNAPPNLCQHVEFRPAWHWNHSSGYGPNAVTVDLDSSTSETRVSSCTATNSATGAPIACSLHPELQDVFNVNGPSCIYNNKEFGGADCCLGNYTLTINSDTDSDGTADTPSVTTSDWGGSRESCIGGATKGTWEVGFTKSGFPKSILTPVPGDPTEGTTEGLNASVTFTSRLNDIGIKDFSYLSNFYTSSGSPHAHTSYYNGRTSSLPYAVEPLDDIDGTPVESGRAAHEIICYDEGWEVKHIILTYIREWNTLGEFLAYETSDGSDYDPDVTGLEGGQCGYDAFGSSCNDFLDLDDIVDEAGGTYDTSVVPGMATTRRTFFPAIEY